jgi:hypothetical protein
MASINGEVRPMHASMRSYLTCVGPAVGTHTDRIPTVAHIDFAGDEVGRRRVSVGCRIRWTIDTCPLERATQSTATTSTQSRIVAISFKHPAMTKGVCLVGFWL